MTASVQSKNNRYYVVLSWQDKGKRKQRWVSTGLSVKGNNKRKAEQKRKEVLREAEERIKLNNYEDILFSDYMIKWLEETRNTVEETTYSVYDKVVRGVICPYFAERKIKLADLKPYNIQDFYSFKMEHDNIAANTIHHYHANIHKALEYAVKTERIKDNPAANIDLPKKKKHVADFYSSDELKTLLQAAKGTDIEMVVYIAAWLGLRRGEILGLKWDCVDFENQTISVIGTMALVDGKTVYKESAKTASSLRTLPMSNELAKYLYDLKERQTANHKQYRTDKWKDFVCVRDNGELLNLDYVTRRFPKLCKQCGLRKIGLHELRHTNISLLISAGVSMKEVQEWAGHSSYITTADIYAHIPAQNKVKLSQTIERLLIE